MAAWLESPIPRPNPELTTGKGFVVSGVLASAAVSQPLLAVELLAVLFVGLCLWPNLTLRCHQALIHEIEQALVVLLAWGGI